MIKIIACRVGEPPKVEEIEEGLDIMCEFVGGRVEYVALSPDIDLWCNEEFLFNGSEPNRMIALDCRDVIPIYGNFFLASHNDEGETIGLTNKQCEEWINKMKQSPIALRF